MDDISVLLADKHRKKREILTQLGNLRKKVWRIRTNRIYLPKTLSKSSVELAESQNETIVSDERNCAMKGDNALISQRIIPSL